jgi:hypothetical protein
MCCTGTGGGVGKRRASRGMMVIVTRSAVAELREMGLLSCDDTTYIQILWLTVHEKHGQTWGWNPRRPGRRYSGLVRGHGPLVERIEQAAGNVPRTLREWDSRGHPPSLLCRPLNQTGTSSPCMTWETWRPKSPVLCPRRSPAHPHSGDWIPVPPALAIPPR